MDLQCPEQAMKDCCGDTSQDSALDGITTERLLSDQPVTIRRRVAWGECDPAGVVYTPRFTDYLVAAYAWFDRLVLAPVKAKNGDNWSTPIKALSLEFSRVLRPADRFDMKVTLLTVKSRTFDLEISAYDSAGLVHFRGQLTPIFVDTSFHSMAMPPQITDALVAYQERCLASAARAEVMKET